LHALGWRFVLISIHATASNIANMQESYVIIWVAKAKDRSGIGKKYFTKNEAEALAADLDNTFPDFRHHAIDTANEEPVNALAALRESLAEVTDRAMPLPEFASRQARAAEVTTPDPNLAEAEARKTEGSVNLIRAA
jgi:hypothetical protein